MNKLTISIIILMLVFIGGIGVYFIFQKSLSPASPVNVPVDTKSLFGIAGAFTINEAAMSTPGMLDAIQRGWTEFRKDDLAYQNLKSNLKKLIQDRTKLVRSTGFSFDRGSFGYFTWNVIEPQKGQFDWDLTDIYVEGEMNAGIKIFAVIQPFAGWDQKNTLPLANCNALDFAYYNYKAGPPNNLAEYKNFLTKTVERYKNKIAVWEIGNEYDGRCGGYENNPEGYFNLVKISSETIKKVNPKAKVTNGGALEFSDSSIRNFWAKFFQLGGSQYLDYFNIHYNIERSLDAKLSPVAFQEVLTFFNNLMDKNGGKKPLYLTEFGIYSGSPSNQPPAQRPGQDQTNLSAQSPPLEQFFNQPSNGKCGDGICDDFEKQNPNTCPQDCGGSVPSGNREQPSGQPVQRQSSVQNVQSNQGQTLRNLSENDQAVLYFKDSILAFANGVKTIFIDLIGPNNNMVGSSMAFNTDDQPRLFLATLKMINSKISNFSKVEKIASGQYKFTIGSKNICALWLGTLPNEILGQIKITDIKGQERITSAAGIKLSADQPVFIELQSNN